MLLPHHAGELSGTANHLTAARIKQLMLNAARAKPLREHLLQQYLPMP
jgi:hypothetical protein